LPGIAFTRVMTLSAKRPRPPRFQSQKGGIRNGLYSSHIRMLDGIDGGNTGVMVLHDGRIHGGDGFFDYIGSYHQCHGRWKGELVNHEHTPSQGERPGVWRLRGWRRFFRHLPPMKERSRSNRSGRPNAAFASSAVLKKLAEA